MTAVGSGRSAPQGLLTTRLWWISAASVSRGTWPSCRRHVLTVAFTGPEGDRRPRRRASASARAIATASIDDRLPDRLRLPARRRGPVRHQRVPLPDDHGDLPGRAAPRGRASREARREPAGRARPRSGRDHRRAAGGAPVLTALDEAALGEGGDPALPGPDRRDDGSVGTRRGRGRRAADQPGGLDHRRAQLHAVRRAGRPGRAGRLRAGRGGGGVPAGRRGRRPGRSQSLQRLRRR